MKSYFKLIMFFLAIAAFISLFPLLLECSETYTAIKQKSEALGIDNSALFYSEESMTSVAEQVLKTKLNHDVN